MTDYTKFRGLKEPVYGKWSWRFLRDMEVGDWFTVKHSDRNPAALAQMIYVRGSELERRFNVDKRYAPGLTKVERMPDAPRYVEGAKPPIVPTIKPKPLIDILREYTNVNENHVWSSVQAPAGHPWSVPVEYKKPLEGQRTFVVAFSDFPGEIMSEYVRVDLEDDVIRFLGYDYPVDAEKLMIEELMGA